MVQTRDSTTIGSQVLHLLGEGKTREQIVAKMLQEGHEEYFARQIVEETAKLRNAKLRSQGLALILAGGMVCFISCVLTLTSSFSSGNFPMVLYGLTTVGIILVFAGFVKIF